MNTQKSHWWSFSSRENKPVHPHLGSLLYSSLAMSHDAKCSLILSLLYQSLCEGYYKYNCLIIVTYLRYSQDIVYFCKRKQMRTGLYLPLGATDNETPDNYFSGERPSTYIKRLKTWAQPWSCSEAIEHALPWNAKDAQMLTFSILSITALTRSRSCQRDRKRKVKGLRQSKVSISRGQTHRGSERENREYCGVEVEKKSEFCIQEKCLQCNYFRTQNKKQ